MGKSTKKGGSGKETVKALKKAKASQKTERKETKKNKAGKSGADEEDLELILEKMRIEWEEAHAVTEETVEGPPTRRANATLTACPTGNYIWLIGGEVLSDDKKTYFFNDVFRYNPEKNEWRKFTSKNCPGPRSAHAVVASPAGGGALFLFGGEFSSPSQNSFHHYRDFWAFSVTTHAWERIDTKIKPSARSGCRMTLWKHFVVLFGGFHDVGIRTSYLKDLWLFDTQTYRWQEVQFSPTARQPSARSGFSFLPTPEGIILHGGYCKEYPTSTGKSKSVSSFGVGKALDDTFLLIMSHEVKEIKWEKRKRIGFLPQPPRSGCTMTYWLAKEMGVLFGGVSDNDVDEETMTSVFYNDMFGYKTSGQGRWISLPLKTPKRTQSSKDKKSDENDYELNNEASHAASSRKLRSETAIQDPQLTIPLERYNAMLAVLKNTLYILGGIYERGSREYTLDDFWSISLDKLDRYLCLRPPAIEIPLGDTEDSSSDDEGEDDDDDDESDEDESEGDDDQEGDDDLEDGPSLDDHHAQRKRTVEKADPLSPEQMTKVTLKDSLSSASIPPQEDTQPQEDPQRTPLPGETLATFYARTRVYWAQRAMQETAEDMRGKELRRGGFVLAEERYIEYKPTLEEVERILEDAGLSKDDIKQGAGATPAITSRNRR